MYNFAILLLEMFTGRTPTNQLFKDDLNLHNFAKLTLPGRVTEIVDQFTLSKEMQAAQDCIGQNAWFLYFKLEWHAQRNAQDKEST